MMPLRQSGYIYVYSARRFKIKIEFVTIQTCSRRIKLKESNQEALTIISMGDNMVIHEPFSFAVPVVRKPQIYAKKAKR